MSFSKRKIFIICILVTLFISSFILFYKQAIGVYYSDLLLHIDNALDPTENAYTITKPIYWLLYTIGKEYAIALFLAIVNFVGIVLTKKVLDNLSKNNFNNWLGAFIVNIVIAIIIPYANYQWNIGLQEANEWHNSTFICMKTMALAVILYYFKISKTYLKKINLKEYLIFSFLLIITNLIKPNFIMFFAPALFIKLLIDFIKNIKNKTAIKNIFILGSSVLLSLGILIYQNMVLFNTEDSSIALGFFKLLRIYSVHPLLSLLQSAAFPLFVYANNIKYVFKNNNQLLLFLGGIFAFIESQFLYETGERMYHGNFEWGYSLALFFLFIGAISILQNVKNKSGSFYIISYFLLGLHFIFGLLYYGRLLLGYGY